MRIQFIEKFNDVSINKIYNQNTEINDENYSDILPIFYKSAALVEEFNNYIFEMLETQFNIKGNKGQEKETMVDIKKFPDFFNKYVNSGKSFDNFVKNIDEKDIELLGTHIYFRYGNNIVQTFISGQCIIEETLPDNVYVEIFNIH